MQQKLNYFFYGKKGVRTLDAHNKLHIDLANQRLKPLSHLSMMDAVPEQAACSKNKDDRT